MKEVKLERAMEVIDDYLNAGTKEERQHAHEKGRELYEAYYGKKYVNRIDRDCYYVVGCKGTSAYISQWFCDSKNDVSVTWNLKRAITYEKLEHATAAIGDFGHYYHVVKISR